MNAVTTRTRSVRTSRLQACRPLGVRRYDRLEVRVARDLVAVEAPLEIRLVGRAAGRDVEAPLLVTLRTPGHDLDLALGLLFAERIITSASDVELLEDGAQRSARDGDAPGPQRGARSGTHGRVHGDAVVGACRTIRLRMVGRPLPWHAISGRALAATAACGACGKASIEALGTDLRRELPAGVPRLTPPLIASLPRTLRSAQAVFDRTGGLHAAALVNGAGDLVVVREDVGRHNAVDKVVGARLWAGHVRLHDCLLVVSGRIGFEIVQKAMMAGIPVLVAVGAPSSMAVDLAQSVGMTLIGFVRGETFNVYAGAGRITRRAGRQRSYRVQRTGARRATASRAGGLEAKPPVL